MLHIRSSRRAHDLEVYQSQQYREEHGTHGERNGAMHQVRQSVLMPLLRSTPARHETACGMYPHVSAADRAHVGHAPATPPPHLLTPPPPPKRQPHVPARPGFPRDAVTNPLRPVAGLPRPGD